MAEMLLAKSAHGSLWTLVPKDVTPVDEDTVPPLGFDDVLMASRRMYAPTVACSACTHTYTMLT